MKGIGDIRAVNNLRDNLAKRVVVITISVLWKGKNYPAMQVHDCPPLLLYTLLWSSWYRLIWRGTMLDGPLLIPAFICLAGNANVYSQPLASEMSGYLRLYRSYPDYQVFQSCAWFWEGTHALIQHRGGCGSLANALSQSKGGYSENISLAAPPDLCLSPNLAVCPCCPGKRSQGEGAERSDRVNLTHLVGCRRQESGWSSLEDWLSFGESLVLLLATRTGSLSMEGGISVSWFSHRSVLAGCSFQQCTVVGKSFWIWTQLGGGEYLISKGH